MTKISNQYSLTNILTADLANSRLGINNVSPTVTLDVTGTARVSGVLTLSSTISNGTYAYTLPSATGTLALTSALSGYLSLTGGTLTGALSGTSATFVGGTTANPVLIVNGDTSATISGNAKRLIQFRYNTGDATGVDLGYDATAGNGVIAGGTSANGAGLDFWTYNGSAWGNRMTLTKAGNVGIGTTDPQKLLHIANTSSGTTTDALMLQNGGNTSNVATGTRLIFKIGGFASNQINTYATIDAVINGESSIDLLFKTTSYGILFPPNERMRITGAGNVGIGTSSPSYTLTVNGSIYGTSFDLVGPMTVRATSASSAASIRVVGNGVSTLLLGQNSRGGVIRGQGGSDELSFWTGGDGDQGPSNSGTERMRISSNGSIGAGGSTTNIYNASDIRLKKNITPITLGLSTISALNPVRFNWADGFDLVETDKILLGFIAQEVQTVIPEAVESFGGSVNLNGTTIENTLRVNEKFIIPVLVKAIQELSAEITILKFK